VTRNSISSPSLSDCFFYSFFQLEETNPLDMELSKAAAASKAVVETLGMGVAALAEDLILTIKDVSWALSDLFY
jgi:hypothetical protein